MRLPISLWTQKVMWIMWRENGIFHSQKIDSIWLESVLKMRWKSQSPTIFWRQKFLKSPKIVTNSKHRLNSTAFKINYRNLVYSNNVAIRLTKWMIQRHGRSSSALKATNDTRKSKKSFISSFTLNKNIFRFLLISLPIFFFFCFLLRWIFLFCLIFSFLKKISWSLSFASESLFLQLRN